MLPLVAIAVALLCILIVQQYRKKVQWFHSLQKFGVPAFPVQPLTGGNLVQMLKLRGFEMHRQMLTHLGPVSAFYFGTLKSLLVADYELIRQVCIGRASEFPNRSNWFRGLVAEPDGFLDASLIGIRDIHWKQQRAAISKSFTDSKLDYLRPTMLDRVFQMIDVIPNKQSKNEPVDREVGNLFKRLTLDIIGSCAFGVATNCQVNEKDDLLVASEKLFNSHRSLKLYVPGMVFDILRPPVRQIMFFKYWFMDKFFNDLDSSEYMMRTCKQILAQRRKQSAEEQARTDLLHCMLQLSANDGNNNLPSGCPASKLTGTTGQTRFTDKEIISNMILFYEAGFETSSTSLQFMAHILHNYPLVQRRLRVEVIRHLYKAGLLKPSAESTAPDADSATDDQLLKTKFSYSRKQLQQQLNISFLRRLHYMDCFIHENMRVYPPVWNFISRTSSQDVRIQVPGQAGEVVLDKDTRFTVPVIHIHHDPKYWSRPFQFRPHRFSNELREDRDFTAEELAEMSRELDQYGLKGCPSLNFSKNQQVTPLEPDARNEADQLDDNNDATDYRNDIDDDEEPLSKGRFKAFRKPDPVHSLAFGVGPRLCIGMRFALLEIKLALTMMLLHYELEMNDQSERLTVDIEYKSITIGAKKEISSRFVPRSEIQQES